MSYSPHWWIPLPELSRETIETGLRRIETVANARLSFRELPSGLGVDFELPGTRGSPFRGALELRFHTQDPGGSDYRTLDELSVLVEENSDEELDENGGHEFIEVSTAAEARGGGSLLVGARGPWLVEAKSGALPRYVRLMSDEAWEARCAAMGEDYFPSFGIQRIRTLADEDWLCGTPNLLFRGEGGEWHPVETGLPATTMLCDVVRFQQALYLLTMEGELWRWGEGRAERITSLPNVGFGMRGSNARFSLKAAGDSLFIANGTEFLHRWDGARLRSLHPPGLRGKAEAGVERDEVNFVDVSPDGRLWIATETRIFVGDGEEWQELSLKGLEHHEFGGLCGDPSGGAWVVGGQQSPGGTASTVVLRVTSSGLERLESPALPVLLFDPQPTSRRGLCAAGEEAGPGGFLDFRPPSVGIDVSMRFGVDDWAGLDSMSAGVNEFVAAYGGWFVS